MRRLPFFVVAAAVIAGPALADTLSVGVDQSARVSLPVPARDVVVGNPAVADVSVLDSRSVLVLGKAYGVTNLLVMDAAGRVILNRDVVVQAPTGAVSVFRGPEVRTYACAALCERVIPGSGGSGSAPAAPSSTPAP